jgi:nitrite reductase/ring-hydroxylating ferredoxin subunit
MAITLSQDYRPGMVDLKAGRLSREIFVSDAIYHAELERLFARAWLFLGHESQIPNPGDFAVSGMGEESVILCRDRVGEVHVFLNSCRHRGMKVCRYDEGNTAVFTCPYHGWSYGTDGRLAGVPFFREAYHSTLDRAQWGLVEVAQFARYKGTVWATWDPAAPSFFEYLGDFRRYLDLTLDSWDGSEGGSEVIGGVQIRNGSSPAIGNSRPRISAATAITTSATARSIWSASARRVAGVATCASGRWRADSRSVSRSVGIRPAFTRCRRAK